MKDLPIYLLLELCLAFGLAGFWWTDELLPVFEVLLFPFWPASARLVRAHSLVSLAVFLILVVARVMGKV